MIPNFSLTEKGFGPAFVYRLDPKYLPVLASSLMIARPLFEAVDRIFIGKRILIMLYPYSRKIWRKSHQTSVNFSFGKSLPSCQGYYLPSTVASSVNIEWMSIRRTNLTYFDARGRDKLTFGDLCAGKDLVIE